MTHKDPLAASLTTLSGQLGHLAQEADSRLLAVGERLGATVDILVGLTQRFEALPHELENETLHDATDHLGKVAQEVVTTAQALVDEGTALARLVVLSQQVGGRIAQLQKTVGAIATLAVNGQIEAAHITAKDEDFSAFANEILRLARTAKATTEGYAREHERVAALVRVACETQAGFARAHEATLRSVGQQLEASLQTVDTRRAQAAGAAAEIGRRSKRISDEISVVVMALQIGDITRQRIEHVGEALDMVAAGMDLDETRARETESWAAALTEGQKAAIAATAGRMQSAQITQAATEFGSEIRRVVASLAQLAEDASAIVRSGNEVYGSTDRTGRSFLEEVRTNLATTDALVRECETARDRVDSAVSSVAASLGDLLVRLGSVRDVEVDMRLVGLNTALKCGRLGPEGRTLSVVAQELRNFANQTVQDADALMSALQEITAAAEAFERDRQNRDANRLAVMERGVMTSLGPLEECGVRLGQALEALAEQGGEVSKMLQETAERVSTHDAVTKDLQAAGQHLDRLIEPIAVTQADAGLIAERMQLLSKGRYTMASERAIHAQFASGRADSAAAPMTSPASVEAALEDVLF